MNQISFSTGHSTSSPKEFLLIQSRNPTKMLIHWPFHLWFSNNLERNIPKVSDTVFVLLPRMSKRLHVFKPPSDTRSISMKKHEIFKHICTTDFWSDYNSNEWIMTEFTHSTNAESSSIFEPHYLLISFEQILISLGEETKTFRLIDERRREKKATGEDGKKLRAKKSERISQQLIELYERGRTCGKIFNEFSLRKMKCFYSFIRRLVKFSFQISENCTNRSVPTFIKGGKVFQAQINLTNNLSHYEERKLKNVLWCFCACSKY